MHCGQWFAGIPATLWLYGWWVGFQARQLLENFGNFWHQCAYVIISNPSEPFGIFLGFLVFWQIKDVRSIPHHTSIRPGSQKNASAKNWLFATKEEGLSPKFRNPLESPLKELATDWRSLCRARRFSAQTTQGFFFEGFYPPSSIGSLSTQTEWVGS